MTLEELNKYLQGAVKVGSSDIHFKPGMPVAFRMKSLLRPTTGTALTPDDTIDICRHIIKDGDVLSTLDQLRDYDTSHVLPGVARFRVNIFRQRNSLALILRTIPDKIPTFKELLLPPQTEDLANYHQGLVLITGATGTGKSSTLAAMIGHINNTRQAHIITIEDPIEYVHSDNRSSISQRELGQDTGSFNRALRAALRQDPDVILVGEMRDLETIDIALKASETGHMVFSTAHTPDVTKSIGRLIGVFPPGEQQLVRTRLAENVKGIMSQKLLPLKEDDGMVVATEIMKTTGTIQDAIRNPELTPNIKDIIERSRDQYGMISFEQSLTDLYKGGLITLEAAKKHTSNPNDFERALHFES